MDDENKRKTLILTFIGALTLLFVVVGGTYAYFQIVSTGEGETSSTLTGETEDLTKYGTPTLTQGTSNLHINLKASDMGYSNKGTEYWATNVVDKDYENEEQQHVISTAKISEAESEDTELSCTSELTIKGKITEMVNGESKEVTVNPLVEEDGYVYLGSKNGKGNKVSINPTQIDLKQIIDKSLNDGEGYQTEVSYTIKGNSSIDITVDIDIINRDDNQNDLAGKTINFTITNKNISCSVKEPKGKAYMKNINESLFASDNGGMGGSKCPYVNVYFVDYIPERNNIDNIGTIDFVDISDTDMGTSTNSVVAWSIKKEYQVKKYNYYMEIEDGYVDAEDLYIGSKSEIYPKDLSNFLSGMDNLEVINFNNLNTSEVTNMSNMFVGYKGTTLDLSNFDTSKVINMRGMFSGCNKLTTLDLSTFDTSKVTDMSFMFDYVSIDLPFKDWPNFVTTNVENMSYMFYYYQGTTLNLSAFDTSKVTNMGHMFQDCSKLTTLDLSGFKFDSIKVDEAGGDTIYATFYDVPESCQVNIKRSQQEIFEEKFPLDSKSGRLFTPIYVD